MVKCVQTTNPLTGNIYVTLRMTWAFDFHDYWCAVTKDIAFGCNGFLITIPDDAATGQEQTFLSYLICK